jgi:hypothetical protein
MIEVRMVNRMAKRGLLVAPVVIAILWAINGPRWGLSAGVGLGLAIGNLILASRIIGAVAQNSPQLLLPAGMVAFALGLAVLAAVAFALRAADAVDFTVMGITLVAAHLVLVLWEAPTAYAESRSKDVVTGRTADLRS